MTDREKLPFRRRSELREFTHNRQRYSRGVSYFENLRRVAEIFLSANQVGSESESIARDGAILASLALQFGADLGTLRHAMTRSEDGYASTAIGATLDLLAVVEIGDAQ